MAFVPPARHLLRAKDLADARYFEPLAVDDMARAAGLSKAHFAREFRRAFGEAPHAYLMTRRLERAAALLRTTDRSVADICLSVGWQSIGWFSTSFTRTFGISPTAYRAKYPPAAAYAVVPACVTRFYGRPQRSSFREDNGASPVGPAGKEDFSIVLMAIPGPPVIDDDTAEEIKALMAKGFAGTVFLTTDDVYGDVEELKSRGVEFTEDPEERPYGIDSGFRDPSGNSFRLTQVRELADMTPGQASA